MIISYLAAFLGGLISLISPCSTLVIPSFLATIGGQRRRLLWSTLIFGLGLLTILIPLSLGVIGLNSWFNLYRRSVALLIGIVLLVSGSIVLSGKEFFDLNPNKFLFGKKKRGRIVTVYFLGLISGLGSTACVGPILGAIITLSFASSTWVQSLWLLLAYGLGILLPFFGLAFTYDSFSKVALKKYYQFNVQLGSYQISLHKLINGLLLLILGYVFVRHQGNMARMFLFSKTGLLDLTFYYQEKLFEIR